MQPIGALVRLGKTLMQTAESSDKPLLSRAVTFRDGLMIALVALRPLRLSNLAAITIGAHLSQQKTGYHRFFNGLEMKGRRSFAPTIPGYIDHYRPILLSRGDRQP